MALWGPTRHYPNGICHANQTLQNHLDLCRHSLQVAIKQLGNITFLFLSCNNLAYNVETSVEPFLLRHFRL